MFLYVTEIVLFSLTFQVFFSIFWTKKFYFESHSVVRGQWVYLIYKDELWVGWMSLWLKNLWTNEDIGQKVYTILMSTPEKNLGGGVHILNTEKKVTTMTSFFVFKIWKNWFHPDSEVGILRVVVLQDCYIEYEISLKWKRNRDLSKGCYDLLGFYNASRLCVCVCSTTSLSQKHLQYRLFKIKIFGFLICGNRWRH